MAQLILYVTGSLKLNVSNGKQFVIVVFCLLFMIFLNIRKQLTSSVIIALLSLVLHFFETKFYTDAS